jgi:hypothetical protein
MTKAEFDLLAMFNMVRLRHNLTPEESERAAKMLAASLADERLKPKSFEAAGQFAMHDYYDWLTNQHRRWEDAA